MTSETKEKIVERTVNGVRLGTPAILTLILWELMRMNEKLDALNNLVQLLLRGGR